MRTIVKENVLMGDSLQDNVAQAVSSNIGYKSKIICKDHKGNILTGENTTVFGGRRFLLESVFGKTPIQTQQLTLNSVLGIGTAYTPSQEDLINRTVCLFGVGTGGASLNYGEIYAPNGNENQLYNISPLRTVPVNNDLSSADRQKYFMRRRVNIGGSEYYQYFLKKFEVSDINVKFAGANYTPTFGANDPLHDPANPLSLTAINIFLTCNINVGEQDVKDEYRIRYGSLNQARFNELGLFFGVPITLTDDQGMQYTEYVAVEEFSKITFNNRPMDTDGSKYDFIYYLMT